MARELLGFLDLHATGAQGICGLVDGYFAKHGYVSEGDVSEKHAEALALLQSLPYLAMQLASELKLMLRDYMGIPDDEWKMIEEEHRQRMQCESKE